MTQAIAKRRWFRFSLRTMFVVVTVVAIFVGYHVHWIRERHSLLDRAKQPPGRDIIELPGEPLSAPGLLWLFGERGVAEIWIHFYEPPVHQMNGQGETTPEQEAEGERIHRYFPESSYRVIAE
jgi:hypothetical protein